MILVARDTVATCAASIARQVIDEINTQRFSEAAIGAERVARTNTASDVRRVDRSGFNTANQRGQNQVKTVRVCGLVKACPCAVAAEEVVPTVRKV